MTEDNKTKALESALGLIEREYGTGSIICVSAIIKLLILKKYLLGH